MRNYILTRVNITGALDLNTPKCVFNEILSSCGLFLDIEISNSVSIKTQVISAINSHQFKSVDLDNLEPSDFKYISRFVNPSCSNWNKRNLIKAFNFLINPLTSDEVEYSQLTNDHPTGYNACMLYRMCRDKKLTVKFETTELEMVNFLKMLDLDHDFLKFKLQEKLKSGISKAEMINLIGAVTLDLESDISGYPMIEHPQIADEYSKLTNKIHIYELLPGDTSAQAIILGALNYEMNLSWSRNPEIEYSRLKNCKAYTPYDPWFRHWYAKNPELFNVMSNFCPALPSKFYKNDELYEMAISQGFLETVDPADCYELLQIAKVSNNFYATIRPGLLSNIMPISLESINELPANEYVFYGIDGMSLDAIKFKDLTEWFRETKNFSNPFNPQEIISNNAIRKLKIIIKNNLPLCEELLKIILEIEVNQSTNDKNTDRLIELYSQESPETQIKYVKIFKILLELGMYLRGWDGSGEYPLSGKVLSGKDRKKNFADIWWATITFNDECENLGSVGTLINNLPLLYYKSGTYVRSMNSEIGLTIGDRIKIFTEGSKTGSPSSCTKVTSNWIVWTSYKYLTLLGRPPDFDISALEYIDE